MSTDSGNPGFDPRGKSCRQRVVPAANKSSSDCRRWRWWQTLSENIKDPLLQQVFIKLGRVSKNNLYQVGSFCLSVQP